MPTGVQPEDRRRRRAAAARAESDQLRQELERAIRQELLTGELAPLLRQRVAEAAERTVERMLREPEQRRRLAQEVADQLRGDLTPATVRRPTTTTGGRRVQPRSRIALAAAVIGALLVIVALVAAMTGRLGPWARPDTTPPPSPTPAAAPPSSAPTLGGLLAERVRRASAELPPERRSELADRLQCWLGSDSAAARLAQLPPQEADAARAQALFPACAGEDPAPTSSRFSPAAFAAQATLQPLLQSTPGGTRAWNGWPPGAAGDLPAPDGFPADGLAGPGTRRALNLFLQGAGAPLRLEEGSPATHYLLAAVLAVEAAEPPP